ncbi:DUF6538 domain-containing protein [Rhodanobacter terrae]|uniref:DUF6538 domain-containing protein n=1 Tax=Rhodanobacter terrae TaxID=418647 RepID=A0ABW0SSZ5_9GAMM
MRLAHHLLRHSSGMWHFRLVVPQALHAVLGLRIIKRSLRTRDPPSLRAFGLTPWVRVMFNSLPTHEAEGRG